MKEKDSKIAVSRKEKEIAAYKAKMLQELFLKTVKKMPAKVPEYSKIATERENASQESFVEMFNNIKNVNMQDSEGWGFLHYAVVRNNVEIVDFLLKSGVDINLKSLDGLTPLFLAAEFCRTEIARKLVENGAKVDVVDNQGNHLLYIAKRQKNTELNEILNLEKKEKEIDIYKNKVIEQKMLFALQKRMKSTVHQNAVDKEIMR